MKFTSYVLLILIAAIINSCQSKNQVSRVRTSLKNDIFYGIDNKLHPVVTDSLISLYSRDMQNSFSLNPIENSIYENEVRIYFAGVWHERFYISRIVGDSLDIDLYNCRTRRKSDSLFMQLRELLTWKGKLEGAKINSNYLPDIKLGLPKDTTHILDKGYEYFIEVKNGEKFKKILVNDEYLEKSNEVSAKGIKDFILNIATAVNFSFYDSWEKIDSTAFIRK